MSFAIQYGASITKSMWREKPNANHFEPLCLLTSIAIHTLYGEKGTKYLLSGKRLVPIAPSDYVLPSLQGIARTCSSHYSKDLTIVDTTLKKFIAWHVNGEPDENIKKFLKYLVLGLASLKKTYEGKLIESNCEYWIKLIWDAVLEPNQRPQELTSTERKIMEIVRAPGHLTMINLLFESAMKELNITVTPLPSYKLPFWSHDRQSLSMNNAPAEAVSLEIEDVQENPLQPKKEIRSKDELYEFLTEDLTRIIDELQHTSPTGESTRMKCQRFIKQFTLVQDGLEEAFDKVMAEAQNCDNPDLTNKSKNREVREVSEENAKKA